MIRRSELAALLLLAPLTACGPSLEPTFDAIATEVLVPSCAFNSCHGGNVPQSGLDFRDADAAWETLQEAPVDSTMPRITPGDPDNSLLYTTLLGAVDDVEQMPKGGALEDWQIEGFRQWIADGAER